MTQQVRATWPNGISTQWVDFRAEDFRPSNDGKYEFRKKPLPDLKDGIYVNLGSNRRLYNARGPALMKINEVWYKLIDDSNGFAPPHVTDEYVCNEGYVLMAPVAP